jgi:DNA-binding HxlR family transcriptional regulator
MTTRLTIEQRAGMPERSRQLLNLLAHKWSILIVNTLEDGPKRFGEIARLVEGISPKVLTTTLRRLEGLGLLRRTIQAEVPLRVDYALTDLGRSAATALRRVLIWAEENGRNLPPIDPEDKPR